MTQVETQQDFPKGHPARCDYDPASTEAIEWKRVNVHPLGERDFPVDHVKAADTKGNENGMIWRIGVDPRNPHLQEFTGRTPAQVEGLAEHSRIVSTPPEKPLALPPIDAEVANAALADERKALGVEVLTIEQHNAVMARLQTQRVEAAA